MFSGSVKKKVAIIVGMDVKDFNKNVGVIQSKLAKLKKVGVAAFAAIGIAATAVAAGVGFIGASIIKTGMQFEKFRIQLKVLYKSAAEGEKAFSWIKEFAAFTPFELPEVVQATIMLKAFGLEAKDVLKDIGDLAAGMQVPLEFVVDAFGRLRAGQTGEAFEKLRRLGITAAKLAEEGIRFGSGGQLLDKTDKGLQRAVEAVQKIIRKDFPDLMQEQAKTTAGLLTNIEDMWTQFKGIVADRILPVIKEDLKKVADFMGLALKDGTFEAWGDAIGKKFVELYTGLREKLPEYLEKAKKIALDIKDAFQWLLENGATLAKTAGIIWVLEKAYTIAKDIKEVMMAVYGMSGLKAFMSAGTKAVGGAATGTGVGTMLGSGLAAGTAASALAPVVLSVLATAAVVGAVYLLVDNYIGSGRGIKAREKNNNVDPVTGRTMPGYGFSHIAGFEPRVRNNPFGNTPEEVAAQIAALNAQKYPTFSAHANPQKAPSDKSTSSGGFIERSKEELDLERRGFLEQLDVLDEYNSKKLKLDQWYADSKDQIEQSSILKTQREREIAMSMLNSSYSEKMQEINDAVKVSSDVEVAIEQEKFKLMTQKLTDFQQMKIESNITYLESVQAINDSEVLSEEEKIEALKNLKEKQAKGLLEIDKKYSKERMITEKTLGAFLSKTEQGYVGQKVALHKAAASAIIDMTTMEVTNYLREKAIQWGAEALAAAGRHDYTAAAKFAAAAAAAGTGSILVAELGRSLSDSVLGRGDDALEEVASASSDSNDFSSTSGQSVGATSTRGVQNLYIAPQLSFQAETIIIGDNGLEASGEVLGNLIVSTVNQSIETGEIDIERL